MIGGVQRVHVVGVGGVVLCPELPLLLGEGFEPVEEFRVVVRLPEFAEKEISCLRQKYTVYCAVR